MVPWVLNSILSKYICSQNPHVRQAACIWLLSLVKKLSQHKEITVGALKLMPEFNVILILNGCLTNAAAVAFVMPNTFIYSCVAFLNSMVQINMLLLLKTHVGSLERVNM